MLIEDNPELRELTTACLEHAGYGVLSAENGQDAIEKMTGRASPSLILLDLMTPVMDGWFFCEERVNHANLASAPLVVVSAVPHQDPRTPKLGAVDYVGKPADLDTLLTVVERWCRAPRHA